MMQWILVGLMLAGGCYGQQQQEEAPPKQRFYRLDYVVKELENDKVINSRAYATTVALHSRDNASIRSGSRYPYTALNKDGSKNIQYYDIGVNIDSRDARELPTGQFAINVNADITSVVVAKGAVGDENPPIVRRTSWQSPVVVPVKKPTTVFSSDDPSGNRKMQLELLATPIN